ncbi:MAG: Fe-S cluster assembly sulfur transfer protein SufU [Nanoarchaeota archaeon]
MNNDLYREQILDLYKHPLNKGVIEHPTHAFKKNNPFCGDEIQLQLVIEGGKIVDVKFNGVGCAISMASASLLTEKIKNMNAREAQHLNKNDILELLQIDLSSVRLKCALLCLDVLRGALGEKKQNVRH